MGRCVLVVCVCVWFHWLDHDASSLVCVVLAGLTMTAQLLCAKIWTNSQSWFCKFSGCFWWCAYKSAAAAAAARSPPLAFVAFGFHRLFTIPDVLLHDAWICDGTSSKFLLVQRCRDKFIFLIVRLLQRQIINQKSRRFYALHWSRWTNRYDKQASKNEQLLCPLL